MIHLKEKKSCENQGICSFQIIGEILKIKYKTGKVPIKYYISTGLGGCVQKMANKKRGT